MAQRRFSRRAYQQAMRRFPRKRRFPGGSIPRKHPPLPGAGYGGLDDLIARLSGGINQSQMNNLAAGRTGGMGWGNIGNFGGRAAGLSPYATHWLATSGVLKQKTPEGLMALTRDITDPTTGAVSQQQLEGPELMRAQLMNSLIQSNASANPMYTLAEGIDEDFLGQIFSQGFGGQSAYEKGFNAEGRIPGFHKPRPWRPPVRRRTRGQTPPIMNRSRMIPRR